MEFTGNSTVFAFDPYITGATQQHSMGVKMDTNDGRIFRYAKAGSSDISQGKLQLAPSPKTNHHNIAVASAAAVQTFKVTVTLGATLATENEYAEGLLCITDATGEGRSYKIEGHPAADASATLELTLYRALTTALTTSSEICLLHNTWNGVIEGVVEEAKPAGVPLTDISAGEYGWLQTKGDCPVLADENLTLGALIGIGSSVAGAVEEMDDVTAPITDGFVGFANKVAGVNEEYRPIDLRID